jgi:hypothetical protein
MGIWGLGKIFDFCKGAGGLGGGGLHPTNTFITYISKYTYFRVIILIVEKQ